MTELIDARTVGLEGARRCVDAARKHAGDLGVSVCVAVADRAGHLVSFDRMDGAPLLTASIAQDKAYTAAAFGLPTHDWWDAIREDPALAHGIPQRERLVIFGGGVPIVDEGTVVGAVGVSGGTPDQDRAVAQAAVAALEPTARR
jgi:glc operon protein GlcG